MILVFYILNNIFQGIKIPIEAKAIVYYCTETNQYGSFQELGTLGNPI
jgi:hypothetical protein